MCNFLCCSAPQCIRCVCCVSGKLFYLTTVVIIIITMPARFVICETALAKHWIHKQKKIVSICTHGQTAHNSMIHKHTYKFRIINCHRRQANTETTTTTTIFAPYVFLCNTGKKDISSSLLYFFYILRFRLLTQFSNIFFHISSVLLCFMYLFF